MTTMLVRQMAKKFAGTFYEQEQRTLRFRAANPDVHSYIAGNWPHFVDMARAGLAAMLAKKDTPQHLKDTILESLLEDNERTLSHPDAREVTQASLDFVEREDRKHIDSTPELIGTRK